jgi:hypothetical protein
MNIAIKIVLGENNSENKCCHLNDVIRRFKIKTGGLKKWQIGSIVYCVHN